MTNIVQNINSVNAVEIDSLRIRIPFEFVEVINSEIIDRIGTYNADTGQEIEEPAPRNFYKTYKQDERERVLYKYKWDIQKVTLEKGRARKFLLIQVNSKKLQNRYLEGITKDNIKLIYKGLMAENVCKFSYKDFLNGYCTDIDFKKDIIHTEFSKAISLLNTMSKEHKQYAKGVKMFSAKDNVGIQWSDRNRATISNPYLKLYNKQIELTCNDTSIPFTETYLRGVDLTNRIRIEYTIKNKKHLNKMGVECQKLYSLLQLDQEQKNKMLESVVKCHLLPRINDFENPKSAISRIDLMIYNLMCTVQELSPFYNREKIIQVCLKGMGEKKGKKAKYEMKKKATFIYDTFVQTTSKSKENDELGNLFDALMWN